MRSSPMSISLHLHHILQYYSNYVSTILTPVARDMRRDKIDPYSCGADSPNKSGFRLRSTCLIYKAPNTRWVVRQFLAH